MDKVRHYPIDNQNVIERSSDAEWKEHWYKQSKQADNQLIFSVGQIAKLFGAHMAGNGVLFREIYYETMKHLLYPRDKDTLQREYAKWQR